MFQSGGFDRMSSPRCASDFWRSFWRYLSALAVKRRDDLTHPTRSPLSLSYPRCLWTSTVENIKPPSFAAPPPGFRFIRHDRSGVWDFALRTCCCLFFRAELISYVQFLPYPPLQESGEINASCLVSHDRHCSNLMETYSLNSPAAATGLCSIFTHGTWADMAANWPKYSRRSKRAPETGIPLSYSLHPAPF